MGSGATPAGEFARQALPADDLPDPEQVSPHDLPHVLVAVPPGLQASGDVGVVLNPPKPDGGGGPWIHVGPKRHVVYPGHGHGVIDVIQEIIQGGEVLHGPSSGGGTCWNQGRLTAVSSPMASRYSGVR